MDKSMLKRLADAQQEYMVRMRREFHRHPEIAGEEYHTREVLIREIEGLGLPYRKLEGTGLIAVIKGGKPGKHKVLRADIDGLQVPEEEENLKGKKACISCVEGLSHACGHDAHTAMLLGAAQLLAECREDWSGEVRFIFQPGEETGKGAEDFITAGCLKGVRRIFGLHVAPDLPLGTVGVKPGLNNAAVDGFRILVQGRSVHVSTPELGVDALYIASHIVVALQAQVARRTSPVEPVILGIGTFQSGTTYNALAETAVLEGTTRTLSAQSRQRAREQVEETVKGIAAVYGGKAQVIWDNIASALVNDPVASAEVAEMVTVQEPDLTVKMDRLLSLGGDNFSEFQLEVPGIYAYLGTADPQKPETQVPIHNGRFQMDEDALPIGAWLYAACARHWLGCL